MRRENRYFIISITYLTLLAVMGGCATQGHNVSSMDMREHKITAALQKGNPEAAREMISTALRTEPQNGYLHLLNGLSYQLADSSQNSMELAQVGYDAAVKFAPGYFWSHYFFGLSQFKQKDYPAAAEQFSWAILDNPDRPYAFAGLAVSAYYAGDLAVAHIAAERALALAPEDPMMLRTVAYVAAASGDKERLNSILDNVKALKIPAPDLKADSPRLLQLLRTAELAEEKKYPDDQQLKNQLPSFYGPITNENPTQVMVEVTLLLSQDAKKHSLGINLLDGLKLQFVAGHKTESSYSSSTGNVFSRAITTALDVPQITYSLNLFNSHDDFYEVVVRPSLVASLGVQSEFFIGRTLSVGVSGINTGVLQTIDVGTSVKITPIEITRERTKFRVDTIRSFFTPDSSGTFTESVTTFKQTVGATVEVDFGKTLILSGLYEAVNVGWISKTPVLGDIPVVNTLFNERSKTQSRDAAIVLVTPRLPGNIETGTREFRTHTLNRVFSLWKDLVDPLANIDAVVNKLGDKISKYFGPQSGDLTLPSVGDSNMLRLAINETIDRL
jgi:Tfp pilus assembly protein PilF